ncbi:MAG: isoamylase early set domain-containing protein [Bacteroidales bacterium]|nr:isoamylase early set domain-containing protein [Bacteroidales bacterium]MBR6179265.1 isoamylase early set domain-containing protein [Bacteroidales bacterium]
MATKKKATEAEEKAPKTAKTTTKKTAAKKEEPKNIFGSKVKTLFSISQEAANNAQTVNLAGDFNNWDKEITVMKFDKKTKKFSAEIELEKGVHQFRYIFDGTIWGNDPNLPTEENDLGINSVIEVK